MKSLTYDILAWVLIIVSIFIFYNINKCEWGFCDKT